MKFNISHLGVIDSCEIESNKLVILTGENNTGKTYIASAIYGFIKYLKHNLQINFHKDDFETLNNGSELIIDTKNYFSDIATGIQTCANSFSAKNFSNIFRGNPERYKNAKITIKPEPNFPLHVPLSATAVISKKNGKAFTFSQSMKNGNISIHPMTPEGEKIPLNLIISSFSTIIADSIFPNMYYLCAQRSGIEEFQVEIDGYRSQLVDILQRNESKNQGMELLNAKTEKYPLIVSDYLSLARSNRIREKERTASIMDNDLQDTYQNIVGGSFSHEGQIITFKPLEQENNNLTLPETSSSVHALMGIYEISRYIRRDDLVFFDEPEANLHPVNQRRMARFIAQIVHKGIKVMVSTHSDIIIRELNTLILFSNYKGNSKLLQLAHEEGYHESEFLYPEDINCYVSEKKKGNTYNFGKKAVSAEEGIEISSFDTTIEEINRIQDTISEVWYAK